MQRNFKIKIIIFSILAFCFGGSAHAASLLISSDKTQVKNNEVFTATLFLDTEGESINTIEGDLVYDENLLSAPVLNTGGSFVSFWVEKPNIKNKGLIHFAGVVPGGVAMRHGEVFSVIFRGDQVGDSNLATDNIILYLNDGQGSTIPTKPSNVNVKITGGGDVSPVSVVLEDTVSPEKFGIVRTKDPFIYDDKYFLVFSTLDKKSGIDRYEVCEYFSCVDGESPHLLRYQNPFYYITVRAYDLNGNVEDSKLLAPATVVLFVVVLILITMVYLYRRYLYRNKL